LKGELRRGKIEELIHSFSKLSSNYNADTVDTWIDTNLDNIKEPMDGLICIIPVLKKMTLNILIILLNPII
jgi:hypothetical protein